MYLNEGYHWRFPEPFMEDDTCEMRIIGIDRSEPLLLVTAGKVSLGRGIPRYIDHIFPLWRSLYYSYPNLGRFFFGS